MLAMLVESGYSLEDARREIEVVRAAPLGGDVVMVDDLGDRVPVPSFEDVLRDRIAALTQP